MDLGVSAKVAPQTVTFGEPLKYTVTMTHTDLVAGAKTDVELEIEYPAFVRYIELGPNPESLEVTPDTSNR
jgi:hypothetical protein